MLTDERILEIAEAYGDMAGEYRKISFARAIQEEAYKAGMAAERERCINHLLASAARLAPEGKRTNQVDRHVADVLATKASELSEVK